MTAVELAFDDTGGRGEPVLLAHAIGTDRHMWDEVAARLRPAWRVIRIDARGHGASPVPKRPYTLEALAADAVGVLDRLAIERAHWIGLSMGGMVGQAVALGHPRRLRRLVIANSTAAYGRDGPAMWSARVQAVEEGGLEAIARTVEARYFSEGFRRDRPDVVARSMERFLATPRQGYLGCCDAIAALEYSALLPRIEAPTLVIAGGADLATPVAMSEAMARAIPGARLALIAGAAHLSAVEDPAEFARLVEDFLRAS